MSKCLDEGILQSYFDGELTGERLESVTSHLALCASCTDAARNLEREAKLLDDALMPEFKASVPTEKLRRRIDAAIAGLGTIDASEAQTGSALSRWIGSVSDLFRFAPQRAFAYSGLVAAVIFALVFGIVLRRSPVVPEIAQNNPPSTIAQNNPDNTSAPANVETPNSNLAVVSPTVRPALVKASMVDRTRRNREFDGSKSVAQVKLLPGERSYLKTIAALDSTIKSGNKNMRPALQAEYERNLALVDRALATARTAAKKSPNDPDAAEFMFTAYQSKVDLLNTVADARMYNKEH
jgi:hypothetical protein